ncbi:MAG: hypothetical protein FWD57_12910, partial [Polyangiaceae bacterium]|nr:hypothetical protein [Polyangiaceae bacterium]
MEGLTERQEQVLKYIEDATLESGYPPSLREIGAKLGIRSTNGVSDHIRALKKKGFVARDSKKSRAIRSTRIGTIVTAPNSDETTTTTADQTAPQPVTLPTGHQHPPHNDNFVGDSFARNDVVEIPILGR